MWQLAVLVSILAGKSVEQAMVDADTIQDGYEMRFTKEIEEELYGDF
jgi:hypothetical protein